MASTADTTMSAGIMTRFAFSMPLFTPMATTRYVMAMNTSMKMVLLTPSAMKLEKYAPPSASVAGPSVMYAVMYLVVQPPITQ